MGFVDLGFVDLGLVDLGLVDLGLVLGFIRVRLGGRRLLLIIILANKGDLDLGIIAHDRCLLKGSAQCNPEVRGIKPLDSKSVCGGPDDIM